MEEACKSLKLVRFFIFSPLSFSSRRFFFVRGFCPTDFTDLHRFSSSWFFFIGFHGWIGRHSCLPDCSRIFAEFWPLANGSRPIYAPVVLVTQISQMTQIFLRGDYFVPQISQIYTDFLWNLCWISLSSLRGYLQRPDRSHLRKSVSNRHSRKSPNKFRIIRWWKKSASSAKSAWQKNVPRKIYVNLWNLWDKKLRWKNLCKSVKSVGLFPTSGGICNDRTGRICEICVTKKQIYTDDSPRFYTFYLVISLFNHTFASNFKVVHF